MTRNTHVAILGAGITGSATALFLARRGIRVTLFDAMTAPLGGASRWNEGKIHLGYLYSADPSLDTARRVLPGGLAFKKLTEQLVEQSLDDACTPHDDTFLTHRQSVTDADAMERYYSAVTRLAVSHPDAASYLVDLTGVQSRRLTTKELEADYDTSMVVAGFRVPERSVSTQWVADRLCAALDAEPLIERVLGTRVKAVPPQALASGDPMMVVTDQGKEGPFSVVVNALWQGRIAIDSGVGLLPPGGWSHRYRLSVFLRTRRPVPVPSTILATGPFGDVKNYDGRSYYLSWYRAGLVAEGEGITPPPLPDLGEERRRNIVDEVFQQLGQHILPVRALAAEAEEVRLEGGWVFAVGRGSLADPKSTLHRRDKVGLVRMGNYYSVDTGKYSIGPWLARGIADRIIDG